nr:immunoglobulin light chain junction region [Macaca mulatta]MOW06534.1 immunoglobulin light chain junction region [Macaca mulatta]
DYYCAIWDSSGNFIF